MINYFKELENPNDQYLDLFENSGSYKRSIKVKKGIPLDFFEKYSQLFSKIKKLNLLFEINNIEKTYDTYYVEAPLEYVYESFINHHDDGNCPFLSKERFDKITYLKNEYISRYKGNDWEADFEPYFMTILTYINKISEVFLSKNDVLYYLSDAKIMAKYQNKLSNCDELLFNEAIKYLSQEFELPLQKVKQVRMYLPNSWYITPNNKLYNTMGKNGHKQANLIYPFYYSIVRDDEIGEHSYHNYFEREYVTKSEFDHYTNLIYYFSTVYPESYYQLSDIKKTQYRIMYKRTYDPKIVKLITGIESAEIGLNSFFYYLKNNSDSYYDDLKFVREFKLDEILIRCCGFHKISSVYPKTITTSCLNYAEEFEEYIKRGWNIDFVKPIVLNPCTKRLEELSNEYMLVKKFHC